MTGQAGLIVLLGSGETSATIRKVYHWLFERLDSPIHLAILETPAGFEPNSARVAGQIADFFQERLQNFRLCTWVIPARKRGTSHSPDDPEILTPLLNADIIMMGPGSPTYAVRQLQNSIAWQTLSARHRLGATLIFASAATVAISAQALPVYEIYKVGEDLGWKPGLNLFEVFNLSLIFIPHWNNNDGGAELDTSRCYMGQVRFRQLIQLLPANSTVVGIDEHTALIIDPTTATGQVMGKGKVTVGRRGREKAISRGQQFELGELGPFCQPAEPRAGIPIEVWNRAVAALAQAQLREEADSIPPREVVALFDKRNVARLQEDWMSADKLRAEIEFLGWRVVDTLEGSQLKPQ